TPKCRSPRGRRIPGGSATHSVLPADTGHHRNDGDIHAVQHGSVVAGVKEQRSPALDLEVDADADIPSEAVRLATARDRLTRCPAAVDPPPPRVPDGRVVEQHGLRDLEIALVVPDAAGHPGHDVLVG